MKQVLIFSLLGLSALSGGGLSRWGAVAAPGAGEEGAGGEDTSGVSGGAGGVAETEQEPLGGVADAITKAGEYKEPESVAAGGAGEEDGGKVLAEDPAAVATAAIEAEKTRLAGELEAARKEADTLKAEQESAKTAAALRSDLETALAPDLDRLEAAIVAREITEDEAAAEAEALAKSWLEDRSKTDELTRTKAELAELKAEKENAAKLANVQKLIAESPEMKVGGEAAQKSVLDLVLKGVDPAEAVAQISTVVASVAGSAVVAQKARDAAAAAAGPNLGGAAPAAGSGEELGTLTFSQALDRAFSWNSG